MTGAFLIPRTGKYARIAGITAGRPAVTRERPLVGQKETVYHKNHSMEEFELWHFFRAQ